MEVAVFLVESCGSKCRETMKAANHVLRRTTPPFSLLTRDVKSPAAVKYKIEMAPTVLVLKDGVEVARRCGQTSADQLVELIKPYVDNIDV